MSLETCIELVALLVALGLGLAAIIQTKIIQKKTYKYMLLNEIINWAESVAAHVIERKRGINLPAWFEGWALLKVKKTSLIEIANSINPGILDAVAEGEKRFNSLDIVIGSGNESNAIRDDLYNICLKIIDLAQKAKKL